MRVDYKRDLNHNYLILHGEAVVNTASYQVRMLLANAIPCLLPCRLQSIDGESLFYYDITSRQSLAAFYEKQKLKSEDLQMIFGQVIRALEDMAAFLMDPGQLVLIPEYLYMDAERGKLFFCCMPGYNKEIHIQFRDLGEYLLPKIDHQDENAVVLGYGVYRKSMEEHFQMDEIKEELYIDSEKKQEQFIPNKEEGYVKPEKTGTEKNREERTYLNREKVPAEKAFMDKTFMDKASMENESTENVSRKNLSIKNASMKNASIEERKISVYESLEMDQEKKEKTRFLRKRQVIAAGGICFFVAVLAGVLFMKKAGYLPWLDVTMLLGILLVFGGTGVFCMFILKKKKKAGDVMPVREGIQGEDKWEEEYLWEKELEREREKHRAGSSGADPSPTKLKDSSSKPPGFKGDQAFETEAEKFGETVVLSQSTGTQCPSLVSKEPGLLATITLTEDLTVIGKLPMAADAVIPMDTVSRIHAKIRKSGEKYYLSDLNSRNGTAVNGTMLKGEEEYCLCHEDEVHFGGAQYIFVK